MKKTRRYTRTTKREWDTADPMLLEEV